VGVVLVAALVFTAMAAAKKTVLTGLFDGGGKARVAVAGATADGKYRKVVYSFRHITVRCDGDGEQRLAADRVAGGNSDESGLIHFGNTVISGPAKHPKYLAKVHGTFTHPGEARGYVRVSGTRVPLKGGGHADCDSGKLKFEALGSS